MPTAELNKLLIATNVPQVGAKGVIVGNRLITVTPNISSGTSGGTYYKCATVDAGTKTWTGYKAIEVDAIYTFESTSTTGLEYSIRTPVIGHIYSEDGLILIKSVYDGNIAPIEANADTFGDWTFTQKDYESKATKAFAAFDGNIATRYTQAPYNALPLWFQAKRSTSFIPKRVKLRHGGSFTQYGTAFTIQGVGSDDSLTTIASFVDGIDFTNTADSEINCVDCELDFSSNTTAYYGIRVIETAHNQGWADFICYECAIYIN